MKKTISLFVTFLFLAPLAAEPPSTPSPVGRWDITVHGPDGDFPSWLEIQLSGHHTLVGSFVGQVGSARPISEVEVKQEFLTYKDAKAERAQRISFQLPPQWESGKENLRASAVFRGDKLEGTLQDCDGQELKWSGRRAPSLKRTGSPTWGEPIELFDGKSMTGWKSRSKSGHGWSVRDGLLVNSNPGTDILTTDKFEDFQLHAEFRYPKGSNSGIYLRGRYEVQIEDNFGEEPDSHKIGGIYGFLTPSVNAAKRPGEWQTMDITLVGRVVTVVFNGERIIDRQTIPGITGGALDSNEGDPGPILLQGDHGPIEFRKVTLRPARP
jgi:hypothetical protein